MAVGGEILDRPAGLAFSLHGLLEYTFYHISKGRPPLRLGPADLLWTFENVHTPDDRIDSYVAHQFPPA